MSERDKIERTGWYGRDTGDGRFNRQDSAFRNWVTADGSPGPTGSGGFAAEPGRYHLYVSWACPWAHRTLIYRSLKGLTDQISISVVNPLLGEAGWSFHDGPGVIPDSVNHAEYLMEIYRRADPSYDLRPTVPVLWDTARGTIVSNESADIIRMLDGAFGACGASGPVFYPHELAEEIDTLNAWIYRTFNNGVYRAGFATTQDAYEEAVAEVFETVDALEARLASRRYLTGATITEADWRVFPTLLRFDPVYVGHFKCNIKRIVDCPNLWGYLRDLYQQPGVAETIDIPHTKTHYYGSHGGLNPTGVVPVGPALDLDVPHRRDRLG